MRKALQAPARQIFINAGEDGSVVVGKIIGNPDYAFGYIQAPEPIIPVGQRNTMETLMAGDCRWPIGDPQEEEFHYCGKRKVDGYSYCDFHIRRASSPSKPRAVAHPHFAG